MKTQQSNKAILRGWEDLLRSAKTDIKAPAFRLNFMDKPILPKVEEPENPKSVMGHYFPGKAAKSKQQTGFQADIKNHLKGVQRR